MALQLHVTLLEWKSALPKLRFYLFREWCIIEASGEVKYFGVAFTSDKRQNVKLYVRLGIASAVMRALHHSVVLKRELSEKAKL